MRDHRVEFRVGAGEDAVELRGRGSYLDQRYTLETQSIVATGPRAPPYQLEAPTRLIASVDHAELAPACFVQETRRICAEGRWQRNAGWSLQAATQSFPLEAHDFGVPGRPRFHGQLFVEARASGVAGQPWLAEVQAEIREALLQYQSASGKEESIALGSDDNDAAERPRASSAGCPRRGCHRRRPDSRTGRQAQRGYPLRRIAGYRQRARRDAPARPAATPVRRHRSCVRQPGAGSRGFADGSAAPQLQGEARLADGTLDFYQANLRLRDIQATLALQEAGLGLRATATAGGGSLDIGGQPRLAGASPERRSDHEGRAPAVAGRSRSARPRLAGPALRARRSTHRRHRQRDHPRGTHRARRNRRRRARLHRRTDPSAETGSRRGRRSSRSQAMCGSRSATRSASMLMA